MPTLMPEWSALSTSRPTRETILVTVKAYPNPSRKYIETVCVAGLRRGGGWVRLYPIPYRFLAYEQQFPTYGWIEADLRKAKEHRPESYHIDLSTLAVTGQMDTANNWEARREIVLPHVSPSIEYLREQQQLHGTSLGIIRPKTIKRLIIRRDEEQWSPEDLAKLKQRTLLDGFREDGTYDTIKELEKVPFKFMYEFVCDDVRCTGHKMSIISWEVIQSFRNWRQKYRQDWETKFRQKYESELPGPRHDLHLYVGTISSHPHEWTIIGLFYPPTARTHVASAIGSGMSQLSLL